MSGEDQPHGCWLEAGGKAHSGGPSGQNLGGEVSIRGAQPPLQGALAQLNVGQWLGREAPWALSLGAAGWGWEAIR